MEMAWRIGTGTAAAAARGASTPTFAALAAAHVDDVYGYLLYLVRQQHLAEDLCSETFERALRRFDRFDPGRGSARTWLLQIARSTALDHFRSERRRGAAEQAAARPDRQEEEAFAGLSPALAAALARLSVDERELVFLRVVCELANGEVAELLGISPSNCSTRLARALQRLEGEVSRDEL